MASKRHRKVFERASVDKAKKDRVAQQRKVLREETVRKEADMEARGALEPTRTLTVVCQACKERQTVEVGNGVPLAACVNCGTRLVLRVGRIPEVVSR